MGCKASKAAPQDPATATLLDDAKQAEKEQEAPAEASGTQEPASQQADSDSAAVDSKQAEKAGEVPAEASGTQDPPAAQDPALEKAANEPAAVEEPAKAEDTPAVEEEPTSVKSPEAEEVAAEPVAESDMVPAEPQDEVEKSEEPAAVSQEAPNNVLVMTLPKDAIDSALLDDSGLSKEVGEEQHGKEEEVTGSSWGFCCKAEKRQMA